MTKAIGYESTTGIYETDHRSIFLDIHFNILTNNQQPFRRHLHAKNATQVHNYRQKLDTILISKDVYKRADKVYGKIQRGKRSKTLKTLKKD